MTSETMTPLQMAARFRARAKEMMRAAELIEAETGGVATANGQASAPQPSKVRQERQGNTKKPTKRERQLLAFLKTRGPSTFNEIKEHSGIPAGTISTLFRKSKLITKGADGKWFANDPIE